MPRNRDSAQSPSRTPIYAVISLIGLLGGTTAIGYYAVSLWMSPPTPMVLALTGILLPLLAVNTVLGLVLSGPDETAFQAVKPAVVPSLIAGLMAVGAATSWFSEEVRTHGFEQVEKYEIRRGAIGALDDPSPAIVARACSTLVGLGVGGHRQPLLDLIDRRPAIARACLADATDGPASEQAREFGQIISERWHEVLLAERSQRNRCELARQLPEMPRAPKAGIPALISCALQAPAEPVRTCCSRQIEQQVGTGRKLDAALGDSVVRTVAERLAAPLVQASLHQLQLSDSAKARAVRLGLTHAQMKRYVAGFACAYTLNSRRTNEVTHQLAAWLDAQSCSSDIPSVDQNINAWHRVCEHIANRLAEVDDPSALICEAARADALVNAVDTARTQLKSAFAGASHQFMQAQILAGIAMQKDRYRGPLKILNGMAEANIGYEGVMAEIMRRMGDDEFRIKVERIVTGRPAVRRNAAGQPAESIDELQIDEETKEAYRERLEQMEKAGFFDGVSGYDAERGYLEPRPNRDSF